MHVRPFEQRPHEDTMERLVVLHGRPKIDIQATTAGVSDENEPSFGGKRVKRCLQGRSDGVDHQIGAPAIGQPTHLFDDIVPKSIDDMGCAKGSQTGLPLAAAGNRDDCLLYTSPSPRDLSTSRMPSSA